MHSRDTFGHSDRAVRESEPSRFSATGGPARKRAPRGSQAKLGKVIIAALIAGLLAMAMLAGCGSKAQNSSTESIQYADSLMVYCAASMKPSMQDIGAAFQQKYGTRIDYNFGGSGTLLTQIQTTQQGDAFIPAEAKYIDQAEEKGLVDKKETLVYHVPAIMVPGNNPAGIGTLADLAKPGVKVVWGDPKACAIGDVGNQILDKIGLKDALWANVIATTATVDPLVVYMSQGQADGTVVWSEMETAGTKMINIPSDQNVIQTVPIASLSISINRDTANAFVAFCTSDEAKAIFESYKFVAYPNPQYEQGN